MHYRKDVNDDLVRLDNLRRVMEFLMGSFIFQNSEELRSNVLQEMDDLTSRLKDHDFSQIMLDPDAIHLIVP